MVNSRQIAAIVGCMLAASSVGCAKSESTDAAPGTTSDVAATINGQTIPRHYFDVQLENFVPGPQTPQNVPVGKVVMERLISNVLIEQYAKQKNVAPTDAQIDEEYQNIKMQHDFATVKPLEEELATAGMTVPEYKETTIRPLLSQLNLLTQGQAITDADLKSYYDLHKTDEFVKPARAHIKRVAFNTQAQAEQIYGQIKAGTKSFEDFVPQSIIHDMAHGDVNSWVPLDSTHNSAIATLVNAVSSMSPNQTAPPFKLQNVWWIVKVIEKKPAETVSFDNAKSTIRIALLSQKAQQNPQQMAAVKSQVRDFQMHSKIAIPGNSYDELIESMMKPEPPATAPVLSSPGAAMPQGAMPAKP